MKLGTVLLMTSIVLALTGCATSSPQIDCPHTGGVMCKRLDEVDRMVSRGAFTQNAHERLPSTPWFKGAQVVSSRPHSGEPVRYHAQVMPVWVAPFIDNKDNYHQPSVIDVVVNHGHWAGVAAHVLKAGAL